MSNYWTSLTPCDRLASHVHTLKKPADQSTQQTMWSSVSSDWSAVASLVTPRPITSHYVGNTGGIRTLKHTKHEVSSG